MRCSTKAWSNHSPFENSFMAAVTKSDCGLFISGKPSHQQPAEAACPAKSRNAGRRRKLCEPKLQSANFANEHELKRRRSDFSPPKTRTTRTLHPLRLDRGEGRGEVSSSSADYADSLSSFYGFKIASTIGSLPIPVSIPEVIWILFNFQVLGIHYT
jgi:hypothetical protein